MGRVVSKVSWAGEELSGPPGLCGLRSFEASGVLRLRESKDSKARKVQSATFQLFCFRAL
jgi:hypothetical protein